MNYRYISAFIIGWITYIGIWIEDYQGGLEIFTQPIMVIIVSSIFVGIAFVFGLPTRIPGIRELWNKAGYASLI
jgi:hypothetical protein